MIRHIVTAFSLAIAAVSYAATGYIAPPTGDYASMSAAQRVPLYAAAVAFIPTAKLAAYTSTDGTTWNPLTNAATSGALSAPPPAVALYCQASIGAAWTPCTGTGGGTGGGGMGTVTSVASGNLSPLFTVSVANPSTTPTLSFTLSSAAQGAFFGGPVGGSGAPAFRPLQVSDLPSGTGTLTTLSVASLTPLFATTVTNPTTSPAVTFALNSQAQNTVFAGPSSGSGTPTFRALTAADLPASTGTVANFGSGNLSPLFSTSVASSTTTPTQTFTLSSAPQYGFFAGPTSGNGQPTYRSITAADLPGGLGTVTTVSSGGLSPLFTATVTNATSTPAIGFAAVSQSPNLVFAGPASGSSSAAPAFRALVANDLPSGIGSGTVTSVAIGGLSGVFTASVTNPTTTPTAAFTAASQTQNYVFAAPTNGNGPPTFRLLTSADIPSGTSTATSSNLFLATPSNQQGNSSYRTIVAADLNQALASNTIPVIRVAEADATFVVSTTENHIKSVNRSLQNSSQATPATNFTIKIVTGTANYGDGNFTSTAAASAGTVIGTVTVGTGVSECIANSSAGALLTSLSTNNNSTSNYILTLTTTFATTANTTYQYQLVCV